MEMNEKMEVPAKEVLLKVSQPVNYQALDPELGVCLPCGCCSLLDCCCCKDCCSCPGCDKCPGCGSCPDCCCSCPGCGLCRECCCSCLGCGLCRECCCSCPSCTSCLNCCCPSCCCPPSCSCCFRMCCCLPQLLCQLPTLACCPSHLKKLLMVVMVVVVIVLIILGVLLFGIFITQTHTETVLQMTIDGLEGGSSQLNLALEKEEAATFYMDDGANDPATIVYDFNKLLIGYKSGDGLACYVTRMDKSNIQGLDMVFKEFQVKSVIPSKEAEGFLQPLVDRSVLGTTINILCSSVAIFWS